MGFVSEIVQIVSSIIINLFAIGKLNRTWNYVPIVNFVAYADAFLL